MKETLQNPIAKWPFGAATIVVLTAEGNQEVDVYNNLTLIDGASVQATGNRTLVLNISPDVQAGARVVLKTQTKATETLTPGEGMAGTVTTGVAGKTFVAEYVYDGKIFIQTAAAVQID